MKTDTLAPQGAFTGPVRGALPCHAELVYETLTAAFEVDPVVRWAFPGKATYRSVFPQFARAYAGGALDHGDASLAGDGRAAAMWLAPGVEPDEESIVALIDRWLEPAHGTELLALMERMAALHPAGPHWYLALLGVQPRCQNQGLGSALLRDHLPRCDHDGRPVYLESSNPRNVSLYLRHGFRITGEIQVGSSPVLWSMIREPR